MSACSSFDLSAYLFVFLFVCLSLYRSVVSYLHINSVVAIRIISFLLSKTNQTVNERRWVQGRTKAAAVALEATTRRQRKHLCPQRIRQRLPIQVPRSRQRLLQLQTDNQLQQYSRQYNRCNKDKDNRHNRCSKDNGSRYNRCNKDMGSRHNNCS